MNTKLNQLLKQAGTIRHLINVVNGIPKEYQKLGIIYQVGKYVHILPPVYDHESQLWLSWEKIGTNSYKSPIYGEFPTLCIPTKVFRKIQYRGLGYLEDINQQIRRFCWQNSTPETPEPTPHTPELVISNWRDYFLPDNSSTRHIMKLYDNWIDNGKLVLIDGEDYRKEFWERYSDCFSDDILPLMDY